MKTVLKKLLLDSLPLKVISLTLGYAFWCMLSQTHTASLQLTVPLTFYNVPQALAVQAPETVHITLVGKRSDLWHIDQKTLALHIDMAGKQAGEHPVQLTVAHAFLPETIKLVDYTPCNLSVHLTAKVSTSIDVTDTCLEPEKI